MIRQGAVHADIWEKSSPDQLQSVERCEQKRRRSPGLRVKRVLHDVGALGDLYKEFIFILREMGNHKGL